MYIFFLYETARFNYSDEWVIHNNLFAEYAKWLKELVRF